MELEIDVRESPEKTVVSLSGEIDAYTAPKLKNRLLPLAQGGEREIEVDLDNVIYMDSTGLGVFISVLKATKESGSKLVLTNLKDRVLRLFKITGLDQVIDIKLGSSR